MALAGMALIVGAGLAATLLRSRSGRRTDRSTADRSNPMSDLP